MITRFGFLVLCMATLGACSAFASDGSAGHFIDLAIREDIPEIVDVGPQPIRIAVAAVLSPSGNIRSYAGLAAHIGEKTGRPVELVQRRTYAEVNDLIAAGEVDLAFVCTSAYISGHDEGDMDLLVVPEINGATVYRSSVIVRSTSDARSIEDLRGASFAFTDPMSLTGRIYPTYTVQQFGSSPGSFFRSTAFTYSHDRAIEAVLSGVVDAAAVDDLVLSQMIESDPDLATRMRIIDQSPAFGIPPVVVPSSTVAAVRSLYEELLLNLHREPGGPAILDAIGVDRFVSGSDEAYEGAREITRAVGLGL